jgi:hypothetical protein
VEDTTRAAHVCVDRNDVDMVRSFHTNPAASEMSVAVVALNQSLKNSDKRVADPKLD